MLASQKGRLQAFIPNKDARKSQACTRNPAPYALKHINPKSYWFLVGNIQDIGIIEGFYSLVSY